jgi:hypothetical protein
VAYDSYTLTTATIPAGTLTLTIGFDSSLPALTIPARTVMDIGKIAERIDVEANVFDLEAVTLTCMEDYSTYADGFWFNAIEAYPDLDVQLTAVVTAGSTSFCVFNGILVRPETQWPELYLTSTTAIREVTLKFVSNLLRLRDVTIEDLITESLTHSITRECAMGLSSAESFKLVRLRDIFASAVHLAFGSTYADDSVLLDDPDILVSGYMGYTGSIPMTAMDIGGVYPDVGFNPMEQYVILEMETAVPTVFIPWGLGNPDADLSFYSLYESALDLITGISKLFQYTPRYYFGDTDGTYSVANANHRIRLATRGRSSRSMASDGSAIRSKMISGIEFENVKNSVHTAGEPLLDWYFNGWGTVNVRKGDVSEQGISLIRPEIIVPFCFYVGVGDNLDGSQHGGVFASLYQYLLYFPYDDTYALSYTDAGYYKHTTAAWVAFDHAQFLYGTVGEDNDNVNFLGLAVCEYLKYRFTPNRKKFDRTYSSIQTTSLEDGINIVLNGGFEKPTFPVISDWGDASIGTGSMAADAAEFDTGYYSVALTGVDVDNYGGISQNIIGNSANTYVITLRAKLVGAGSPTLRINWNGTDVATFTPTGAWGTFTGECVGYSGVFAIENLTATQINIDNVQLRLKAGSTVPMISILDTTLINNGVEETLYYASEIERDIMQNTTRVVWTEE